MTPNETCYTHWSVSYLVSTNIREVSFCSKWEQIHRLQPDIVQKVRAMKHPVLNGMSHLNFSELREHCRRWDKKSGRTRGLEGQKNQTSESTEKGSCGTETQTQGLHGWYQVLWVYIRAFRLVFYGTPECLNEWASESCEFSWCSFPLVCLVQLQCDYVCFLLSFYCVKNNFYCGKKKTHFSAT